ncbi:hypothetical protein [Elizabethkingia anophelis]|uniref:hypothetical protein n=1 Tax=Elizabethkingia anophelis TaxID=1117645 RepID=UPI001316A2B4|nr:hypothetical protein [Elizabethkingia anophelis]MBE9392042.1 hypothetical protein [Elizabethkingia anophelis]MBE9405482.1 hypothetical protein [Elizabethkingia anophelis]BBQ06470.1 hypothetical protein JUNP353_1041 [Elizabethkingia anophelis]
MKKNKACLIILSHSSYSDIWEITLKSYKKYFNSIEVDLYLTSDDNISPEIKQMVIEQGFSILYYPENISWSESLKKIINDDIIGNYNSVIFSFDDLVLLEKVNTDRLNDCFKMMDKIDYLILNDGHHNLFTDISLIGSKASCFEIPRKDSYIGSLVFSLWKTDFIYEIINLPELENLNPWQYEVKISKILVKYSQKSFFALKKPLVNFSNVIVKGKILKGEMDRVKNKNTISYNGSRLYMNSKDEFKFNNYRRVFKLARYLLPHSIFEKLRKSY